MRDYLFFVVIIDNRYSIVKVLPAGLMPLKAKDYCRWQQVSAFNALLCDLRNKKPLGRAVEPTKNSWRLTAFTY